MQLGTNETLAKSYEYCKNKKGETETLYVTNRRVVMESRREGAKSTSEVRLGDIKSVDVCYSNKTRTRSLWVLLLIFGIVMLTGAILIEEEIGYYFSNTSLSHFIVGSLAIVLSILIPYIKKDFFDNDKKKAVGKKLYLIFLILSVIFNLTGHIFYAIAYNCDVANVMIAVGSGFLVFALTIVILMKKETVKKQKNLIIEINTGICNEQTIYAAATEGHVKSRRRARKEQGIKMCIDETVAKGMQEELGAIIFALQAE